MSDNVTLKVSEVVPALTARAQLGQILDRVSENGERFLINKRGAPTRTLRPRTNQVLARVRNGIEPCKEVVPPLQCV